MTIAHRIDEINKNIEDACKRVGRDPSSVTLVGASKTKPAELINEARHSGLAVIGENRVQELMEKYDAIEDKSNIHLIGHLQTNKVKYIAGKVSLIHSVDSDRLAKEMGECTNG